VATISSLLADHVTLGVRSVDRLFLQGYVPRLMTEGQVIRFLLDRGFPIPSPAVLGRIGRDYVNRVNAYIAANEIPTVRFVKGSRVAYRRTTSPPASSGAPSPRCRAGGASADPKLGLALRRLIPGGDVGCGVIRSLAV
jgi:hypothetical protein